MTLIMNIITSSLRSDKTRRPGQCINVHGDDHLQRCLWCSDNSDLFKISLSCGSPRLAVSHVAALAADVD